MNEMDGYSLYSYRNMIENKKDFYFFDNKISISKIITSISPTIKSLLLSAAAYQWQLDICESMFDWVESKNKWIRYF